LNNLLICLYTCTHIIYMHTTYIVHTHIHTKHLFHKHTTYTHPTYTLHKPYRHILSHTHKLHTHHTLHTQRHKHITHIDHIHTIHISHTHTHTHTHTHYIQSLFFSFLKSVFMKQSPRLPRVLECTCCYKERWMGKEISQFSENCQLSQTLQN